VAYKTNPEAQEALAAARFIRMSPTKARQVVDLIRGRHIEDARRVLKFTPRAAAPVVGKVLESAIANAEHNNGLPGDELVVTRAWVDEGPTLKRYRPRAQGRATRIRKRTCHIAVVVGRQEDEILPERPATKQTVRRVRKDTAGKPATRKSASKQSQAEDAAPEATSKTTRKTTAKKTTAKTTAKKTTAKKTAKKSTSKKTTKKKTEGDK
jgi:large subunit ribosomal protein L22